ncbi:unnamed protein product [Durusdinium trenchii]|uniref:Uncharacterized protein n=2 Tax=Durusdinium trenchii TaxID=1381693 RepID=A0ABP0QZL9_9DINO
MFGNTGVQLQEELDQGRARSTNHKPMVCGVPPIRLMSGLQHMKLRVHCLFGGSRMIFSSGTCVGDDLGGSCFFGLSDLKELPSVSSLELMVSFVLATGRLPPVDRGHQLPVFAAAFI